MDYQFVAVDGTGPGDDKKYFAGKAGSFCQQIRDALGTRQVDYNRGPSDLGAECSDLADWALNSCEAARRLNKKIFMAGFSRGGAVVIAAAFRFGHAIDSLFLFDAVDRSAGILGGVDGYKSQCNVDYVFHLRRDPSISDPLFSAQQYSRSWFGNCGLADQWPGHTRYQQHMVPDASHAAVGGCPWLQRPGDKAAVRAAASWMSHMMQTRGLLVTLTDKWFDTERELYFKNQQAKEEARRYGTPGKRDSR
jgi:pimeloyl-ACP methyl ester carboxylesterase